MSRLGKFALAMNEQRNNRHAELRRALKRRAHKVERRAIRIVLTDQRVLEARP